MGIFYKSILLTAAVALSLSSLNAQTVTVSKTGTITTVQEAISSFDGDVSPEPNLIEITDSEVYDEIITVDEPVTIQGASGERPRLTVKANPNGRAGSAGLVINLPSSSTTGSVVLRNLVILPSLTETLDINSAVNVYNNNAFVVLDDILITANDGSNQPISTDGIAAVAVNGSHKHFNDDLVVAGEANTGQFAGDGVELLLRDTIITNSRGSGSSTNGVLMANSETPGFRLLRVEDGCVFSHLGQGTSSFRGYGISVTGDFELNAPTDRVLMTGLHYAIFFDGDSPNTRLIRGAIVASNFYSAVHESSGTGVRMTIEDSIFANQGRHNFWALGGASSPITMRRVTIVNQTGSAYNAIRMAPEVTGEIIIEDSIIGGNNSGSLANIIYNENSSTLQLSNTAVIASGAFSLESQIYLDPASVSGEPVITVNPQFENTTDFSAADFYNVSSTFYAELASDGGPLSGGASYSGVPIGPITEETITVSKSGSPDFGTIQGAIDSLVVDATKHYTIEIQDSSVYDEIIDIDVPLTLIGNAEPRPILAVQENVNGFDRFGSTVGNSFEGGSGLLINIPETLTTSSVELKNLVIIPSMAGNVPMAGIVTKANNVYLQIENVLVTANDGLNAPITADGLVKVEDNAAFRYFSGGGAHLGSITNDRPEGDGVEVRLKDCVFTHATRPGISATDPNTVFKTGLHMYRTYNITQMGNTDPTRPNAYRSLKIGDGCVFSYNANGIRIGTNVEIFAPNERMLVMGNQTEGIWLESHHGAYFDGFTSILNGKNGFSDQSNIGRRPIIKNGVVADNGWYNLYFYHGSEDQTPTYIENVTTANQSTPPTSQPNLMTLQVSGGSGGAATYTDVVATNVIFAGHGDLTKTQNQINWDAHLGGSLTLDHTAVVTEGLHALIIPAIRLETANSVIGDPITSSDPMFLNTTDPTAPNFYAVSNPEYGNLSSTGAPLTGGGNYAPASVSDWSVY